MQGSERTFCRHTHKVRTLPKFPSTISKPALFAFFKAGYFPLHPMNSDRTFSCTITAKWVERGTNGVVIVDIIVVAVAVIIHIAGVVSIVRIPRTQPRDGRRATLLWKISPYLIKNYSDPFLPPLSI